LVSLLAARTPAVVPDTMTSGLRPSSSSVSDGTRPISPSAADFDVVIAAF
jgi:hypothetical protein